MSVICIYYPMKGEAFQLAYRPDLAKRTDVQQPYV